MDAVKVGLAVQSGVSVVCATCQRYWEGRERGLPGAQCTARRPCGSPLSGNTFGEYRGPIRDFTRWCFVCGATAAFGVRLDRKTFGMCHEHIEMLKTTRPVNSMNGFPVVEVLAAKDSDLKALLAPKPKSLMQEIAKTEAEFREIERDRG